MLLCAIRMDGRASFLTILSSVVLILAAGCGGGGSSSPVPVAPSNLVYPHTAISATVGQASPRSPPCPAFPDGTLIDAYAGGSDSTYVTNILKNGKLVAAIPGVALGWIDNSAFWSINMR
jgi:hypothetical protein